MFRPCQELWPNMGSSTTTSKVAIRAQAMTGAVPDFKSDVKRPTGCRVLCVLSLLGAPARTLRAPRRVCQHMCQQHERARWWHLQLDSLLQSSSHATGGCHWSTHNRHRPRFAPRGSLGTRPSPRRRRARRLRGDHRQSTRSWFVVEYVTSFTLQRFTTSTPC